MANHFMSRFAFWNWSCFGFRAEKDNDADSDEHDQGELWNKLMEEADNTLEDAGVSEGRDKVLFEESNRVRQLESELETLRSKIRDLETKVLAEARRADSAEEEASRARRDSKRPLQEQQQPQLADLPPAGDESTSSCPSPSVPSVSMLGGLLPVMPAGGYTLVLDLDETLVHYEPETMICDVRPGAHEFLARMHRVGYEIVIFTASVQEYADWVIDNLDPEHFIHHRLYRHHAIPCGQVFIKDLQKLGRDLDHTLIVDNISENFALQPQNGVHISTWTDDVADTALISLAPMLEELITSRARVQDILDQYKDVIPTWAGHDLNLEHGAGYESEVDGEDWVGNMPPAPPPSELTQVPTPRTPPRSSAVGNMPPAPPPSELTQVPTPTTPPRSSAKKRLANKKVDKAKEEKTRPAESGNSAMRD